MDIRVLYSDEQLLVIDKPPGIVVNRAESVKGKTLQDWAEEKLKVSAKGGPASGWKSEKLKVEEKDFYDRSGIVHRLDKETSGVLLIARTPLAFRQLQHQFKERLVKKTYLAIAHGKIVPETGEIRAPVGRLPWNRERFGIVPGGREAVTRYRVVSYRTVPVVKGQEQLSLVELYPETGRTHQLRVHLKYINHPIVGDFLYAGRKTSRSDRVWAGRVMLHAWKITFMHPASGEQLAFEAPIPDDMKAIVQGEKL